MSINKYYKISEICDVIKKFIPNKYYNIEGEISKPTWLSSIIVRFKLDDQQSGTGIALLHWVAG